MALISKEDVFDTRRQSFEQTLSRSWNIFLFNDRVSGTDCKT
jgi:hypothetical protein